MYICVVKEECSAHSIKLWKCICRIDLNIHSYGIYYITDGCHTISTWIEDITGFENVDILAHGFLRNLIWKNSSIEVNKFCTILSYIYVYKYRPYQRLSIRIFNFLKTSPKKIFKDNFKSVALSSRGTWRTRRTTK